MKAKPKLVEPTHLAKLLVTVTKTADGQREYLQVISSDQFTVNVVLIADLIEVKDGRSPPDR